MKCYVIVKPHDHDDEVTIYGIYENKYAAEKDMHRLDGYAFQLEYDGIEIREFDFHKEPSKFYTVTISTNKDFPSGSINIFRMTNEPIIPKRIYKYQLFDFSIDADSKLVASINNDPYKVRKCGLKMAKCIDELVIHLLDYIKCDLEPGFDLISNTTINMVNTEIIYDDKYHEIVDSHPEIELALNNAMMTVQEKLIHDLEFTLDNYNGHIINLQLLNQIKEDVFTKLDEIEFYRKFNFRKNPSLIPLIKRTIINNNTIYQ